MIRDLLNFKTWDVPELYSETIKKSLVKYTTDRQLLCFVEELAECLTELLKPIEWPIPKESPLFTEMADVVVAIETIKVLYAFNLNNFKGCYEKYTSEGLQASLCKLIIGVSHYERGRITADEFCQLIYAVYFGIQSLPFNEKDFEDEIVKKFTKYSRQIADK